MDVQAYDDQAPEPAATRSFTAALGCFWGPDAKFGALPGVVRTRVGYAGGTDANPTYESIGDHSEVVQVDYDPDATTFRELVDEAISQHDPTRQPPKRQYQHVLFHEADRERNEIETALGDLAIPAVRTRIEPFESFTVAEPYHQKFNLSGKRWATDAFDDAGYDTAAVRESPAAAKLNAELAGHDVPDLGALADRSARQRPGSGRDGNGR
jgi:peptide-methionine (S)-S-oxide reductase